MCKTLESTDCTLTMTSSGLNVFYLNVSSARNIDAKCRKEVFSIWTAHISSKKLSDLQDQDSLLQETRSRYTDTLGNVLESALVRISFRCVRCLSLKFQQPQISCLSGKC